MYFNFLRCVYIKKHNTLNSTLRSIHWKCCNAALPLHHFGLIMTVMPWYAMIAVGLVLPYNVHQGGGQVSRGRVMLRKLTLTRIWVVQSWSHDPYQRLKCTSIDLSPTAISSWSGLANHWERHVLPKMPSIGLTRDCCDSRIGSKRYSTASWFVIRRWFFIVNLFIFLLGSVRVAWLVASFDWDTSGLPQSCH